VTEGHYPFSLLRNNGDFTFTDVTEEAGLLRVPFGALGGDGSTTMATVCWIFSVAYESRAGGSEALRAVPQQW